MGKSNFIRIFILTLLSAYFIASANFCLADNLQDAFKVDDKKPLYQAANQGAGYNTKIDAETIIGLVIQTALGLMGVIFLALAIYGGYNWMMARGNDEMVEKAKNTLTNAIIGLVIVLAAYAVSWYILEQISTKTLK